MTEFEEKKLEEIKKQHEEHLKFLEQQDREYLNYLKQCDIERRNKEEEFNEGCHKLGLLMLAISVICFIIATIFLCC